MKLNLNLNNAPQQQDNEEGWGGYLLRNLAKTPAALLQSASITRGGIPTTNYGLEALREINPAVASQLEQQGMENVPSYFTEHRPGDEIPALLQSLLLPLQQAGGFKSVPRALEAAKTGVGTLIGGEAGRTAAELAGLGHRGQALGSFLGGATGGTLARHTGLQRPSSALSRKDFEHQKSTRTQRIADLEKLQKENYASAELAARGKTTNASKLKNALTAIEESAYAGGIESPEQKRIVKVVNDLQGLIKGNKLDLNRAIRFKQNLNKTTYDKNIPDVIKRYNQEVLSELNNFIKESGAELPEHAKSFERAEKITKDLAALKQEQREIGDLSYKDFLKRKQALTTDEFLGKVTQLAKGEILPTTITGIGYLLGGKPGAKIAGSAVYGGRFLASEVKHIREILKNNPALKQEIKELGIAALKEDFPLFQSRLLDINRKVKVEEEKDKIKKGSRLSFRV